MHEFCVKLEVRRSEKKWRFLHEFVLFVVSLYTAKSAFPTPMEAFSALKELVSYYFLHEIPFI